MTALADFLTRVRDSLADDSRTDSELIRAYVANGCGDAFAGLVRRFAPMVWGVCRRRVGDRHLAEDAFQAVFLVLVRRANAIHPTASVGGWLHAVAVHTSIRARAMVDRRRRRESLDPTVPDRSATEDDEPVDPDLLRILDEEIAGLPDGLRSAVALCEIGGASRRDAAARLGIAEGTLSSRLAAARKQLAIRLRSRGVTAGVAGIVAGAASAAAGAVPQVISTHSHTVTALAEGTIRMIFLNKLFRLSAVALVSIALLGVGLTAYRSGADEPHRTAKEARPAASAPVPKPAREGQILVWVGNKPLLIKPDGTELPSPNAIPKVTRGAGRRNAQLSADGSLVAFPMQGARAEFPRPKPMPKATGLAYSTLRDTLKILDLKGNEKPKSLEAIHLNSFYWLGDGKTLYVCGQEIGAGDVVGEKLEHWVYDVSTDKRTPLKVPENFYVWAIAPDGKSALLDERSTDRDVWYERGHLWTIGTDKPSPLLETNESFWFPRPVFSPAGTRLLCRVKRYGSHKLQDTGGFHVTDFKYNDLVVIDFATKKRTTVKRLGEKPDWRIEGLAWSPDGEKIAYIESQLNRENPVYRVIVADPDGTNVRGIYRLECEGEPLIGFDWK